MSELEHSEGHVTSSDGLRLYWQRWMPEAPKAILLFVHGLGDHSGRYPHVAECFGAQRFGCYGLDYRCHGKSPGLRVHVDDFDEFLGDVDAMREHLRGAHPDLPLFLVGHSMGGLITLLLAMRNAEGIDGLVISSPFLGTHPATQPPAILVKLLPVISKLLPRLRVDNGIDSKDVSTDPEVGRAYDADPLCSRKISTSFGVEVLEAHRRCLDGASSLSVPTLLMYAGADRIVDIEPTRRFGRAAPSELVEVVEWEGMFHEIFNEVEKEQVFARMERWLDERLEG